MPYPPSPAGRRGTKGGEGEREGSELRMRNCELRAGGEGDFGAVVKRTQMGADEGRWTQINPPIDTDFH